MSLDGRTKTTRRFRRTALGVYAFSLLVMVLIPPVEGEYDRGVEYVSVFERPERYAARPVPPGTDLVGWVEEQQRGPGARMGRAPVVWGRVATQVVWLSLLAGLAFAAAPVVAGRVHRDQKDGDSKVGSA